MGSALQWTGQPRRRGYRYRTGRRDGNIYVTGFSTSSGTAKDYATVKYAPDGTELWVARYDGPAGGEDMPRALVLGTSGNVYVTGLSTGDQSGTDYATIKYASHGLEEWVIRYDGPASGSDEANDIELDAEGNVYVTGRSQSSNSDFDYATIKYAQIVTGTDPDEMSRVNTFSLAQSYPNPFNPRTTIKYKLPFKSDIKLVIYNLLGQEVFRLVRSSQQPGEHFFRWNGKNIQGAELSSGIFFYQLQASPTSVWRAGDFVQTRKMLLLK